MIENLKKAIAELMDVQTTIAAMIEELERLVDEYEYEDAALS